MNPEPIDITLPSGRLRAHRHGDPGAPLALCVPGLSANSRCFDALAAGLAESGRCAVALELRGRGHSDTTAPGTYGWANHARDVVAAATTLAGSAPFDLVGHSMGAFVGMEVAGRRPAALRRLVLVDAAGVPDQDAAAPIGMAVQRLGAVHPSADEFVRAVRAIGTMEPWSDLWETYLRYDLVPVEGGVQALTDRDAVMEDVRYAMEHDPRRLWAGIAVPVLLVVASRPLLNGRGRVVTEADREAFVRAVPGATAVDVDANHYGVVAHAATVAAVRSFLDG